MKNIEMEKELNPGNYVIAFNDTEWSKIGDLPEGNSIYYQEAIIIQLRLSKSGEKIADLFFKSGMRSNGHFVRCLSNCK